MRQKLDTKILIVSSNKETFNILKEVLSAAECDGCLVYAQNTLDAIEKLNAENIGLIITSVKLDDYTGISLAHHVRKFGDIPIMVVSNYEIDQKISRGLSFWHQQSILQNPVSFVRQVTKKIREKHLLTDLISPMSF